MDEEKLNKIIDSLTPKVGDKEYVGPVGDGLYQIGEGCYTSKVGYEEFIEEVEKELKKYRDGE